MAGQGPGPQAEEVELVGIAGRTRGGMLAEVGEGGFKRIDEVPSQGRAGFLKYQSMAASMSWRACARGIRGLVSTRGCAAQRWRRGRTLTRSRRSAK